MKKDLFKTKTIEEAEKLFYENYQLPGLKTQLIKTQNGLGRIAAREIFSPEELPPFTRTTMDGYAVRSIDVQGASEEQPLYLKVTGEVNMGEAYQGEVGVQQAVKISTGGMLPAGADSVVMIEYTEQLDIQTIEVVRGVAPGENLVEKGEDIKSGDVVIDEGWKLRPQDIGALLAVGLSEIEVFEQPKVGIISTGDELVAPQEKPRPGQIRDINSSSLQSSVVQTGALAFSYGIIKDIAHRLEETLKQAVTENDVVLISGGSSVGTRDMTLDVLEKLANRKVLVHGLAIKPGKPTLINIIESKPVFGLPGHPAAALTIFAQLVRPLLAKLSGYRQSLIVPQERTVEAYIDRKVASAQGRLDFVRVKLFKEDDKVMATPVLGSSGLIQTLIKADGLVKIPLNTEGLAKGEKILVELF